LAAAAVGASIGALTGFFFFTERGRDLRARIDPALDRFAEELGQLRGTATKAAALASEGWRLLNDTMAEGPRRPMAQSRQTSPF
jgi:hypothetical protein